VSTLKHLVLVAVAGLVLTAVQVRATTPVSVSVWPAVMLSRGDARLTVLVERSEKNRELKWEIDSPEAYRSGTLQLDGASAPSQWLFQLRTLEAGAYTVRVTVTRGDRSQAVAQTELRVLGR
jgi:hypothetical protein